VAGRPADDAFRLGDDHALCAELPSSQRCGQAGGTGSDDDDLDITIDAHQHSQTATEDTVVGVTVVPRKKRRKPLLGSDNGEVTGNTGDTSGSWRQQCCYLAR
jgi:hypothetical protein